MKRETIVLFLEFGIFKLNYLFLWISMQCQDLLYEIFGLVIIQLVVLRFAIE